MRGVKIDGQCRPRPYKQEGRWFEPGIAHLRSSRFCGGFVEFGPFEVPIGSRLSWTLGAGATTSWQPSGVGATPRSASLVGGAGLSERSPRAAPRRRYAGDPYGHGFALGRE